MEFFATSDCATRTSKYCSRECGWTAQKAVADAAVPSREDLEAALATGGTVASVARRYGKSDWWAKRALRVRGVPEPLVPRSEATCESCGKSFVTSPSAKRRFCSRECYRKEYVSPMLSAETRRKASESKRGDKNPMWRGVDTEGSIYRVFNVRLKGESCCRNCGCPYGVLHLHHIVPRSLCKAGRRDLRNGVTLCPRCHLGWHNRSVVIYRDILTPDEWAFVSTLPIRGRVTTAWLEDRYPERKA